MTVRFTDADTGAVLTRPEASRRIIDRFLAIWVDHEDEYDRIAPIAPGVEGVIHKWIWGFEVPLAEIDEAIEIAFDRDPDEVWPYFCGVVWTKIRNAASAGWEKRS